jgi:hypothetical protein
VRSRPIRLVIAVLVTSAVATACELIPRRFDVVLPEHLDAPAGSAIALPVVVLDHTGLVAGLEAGPPGRGRSFALHRHETRPTVLVLDMPGGGCEREAIVEMLRTESGYRLTVRVTWITPCVPFPAARELHLILAEQIDPAEIELVPVGGFLDPPTPSVTGTGPRVSMR